MRIKTTTPIKALLAQLPEGTITYIDLRSLSALNECIKALRVVHEGHEAPSMFTTDVRHAFALSINEALAKLIQEHIPKRASAKPKADEERTELQAIKRSALELREALEKFERICIDTAGFEPVGSFSDGERRRDKLEGGLPAVQDALHTLKTTRCRHVHLWEQMKGMEEHWKALNASCERWIATAPQTPSAGKAAGVHKGKALADWLDACKTLGRDIAEAIRDLK